jgi:putative transposase
MTYRLIEEHKEQWPVRWLCQTPRVCPAGYYAWRRCSCRMAESPRHILLVEIRAIHTRFKAHYGNPRIHAELAARGHDCCVNTVAKLMREAGIAAKPRGSFAVPPRTRTTTCP